MFPWLPTPRSVCLLLLCLGSTLATAAEAPYIEDFNRYPNGSVPANFVETSDGNWAVGASTSRGTNGYYLGSISVSGGQPEVAAGLPLTNVPGRNFTVKTTFAASTNGGDTDFRHANLGLVALADPTLTAGGYRLSYYVSGLLDVYGKLFLERVPGGNALGAASSSSLRYFGRWDNFPSANPHYTMTLHGAHIDGTLFLTGTVGDGVQTIYVQMSDTNPLTGPFFGLRESVATSTFHIAALNGWYDDFSVTFETRPVKLGNISTRLHVGTGNEAGIGGFIVTGNTKKRLLIRGDGAASNWIPDPFLELRDDAGWLMALNDNWKDAQQTEIQASGLAPYADLNSAMIVTLSPGAYSAALRDKNGASAPGMLEIFDLDPTADSRLANFSARAYVGTGDDVMIAGVIPSGDAKAPVIVRALGPSLRAAGISNPLIDPTLELRDGNGALVKANDNWRETQQTEIVATSLAPSDDAEAAIVADLLPINYTAIVRGKNDTTGVALVDVFHLNEASRRR